MRIEKINQLRVTRGLTVEQLSVKSGVPAGTLAKITSGSTTNPKYDTVDSLAHVLGCSLDEFSSYDKDNLLTPKESEHINRYRRLDPHGRSLVDLVLSSEYNRVMAARNYMSEFSAELMPEIPAKKNFYSVFLNLNAICSAAPREGYDYRVEEQTEGISADASYGILLPDNRLEPYVKAGSVVHAARPPLSYGDVGLFCIDGKMLFRQYVDDEHGNMLLFKINNGADSEDIALPPGQWMRAVCLGRIMLSERIPLPPRSEWPVPDFTD